MKTKMIRKMVMVAVCSLAALSMAATALPASKVTISVVLSDGVYRDVKQTVEQFNKEHPDIQVDLVPVGWVGMFERLITRLVAGTEENVIHVHSSWVHRLGTLGFLTDLTPYTSQIDLQDFWPSMVEHFRYKGKQLAIPFLTDVYGYAYNADMYKEVGLNPDRPPQDWEELLSHLQKLTAPEKGRYGFGLFAKSGSADATNQHNMFIQLNQGSVLNESYTKCTLDEKPAIDAIRFVTDLYLKHKVCSPGMLDNDQNGAYDAFAMKTTASCIISVGHASQVLKSNPSLDLRGAPLPKGKQWKGDRAYGAAWGISNKFPHKKEAWEFIKYMTSPENAKKLTGGTSGLGPRISVAKSHPALARQPYKGLIDIAEKGYSVVDPPIPQWYQITLAEINGFQKIYLKRATVEEAMSDLTKEINKILQ